MTDTILVEVEDEVSTVIVDVIAGGMAAAVVEVFPGISDIDYPQLPDSVERVLLSFPVAGRPAPNGAVHVPMGMAIDIPAGLAGTVTYAAILPTGDAVFLVNRITAGGATQIGTVTLTASSTTSCILGGSGGRLEVGDVLQLVAPVLPDPTLSDLGITIMANRT